MSSTTERNPLTAPVAAELVLAFVNTRPNGLGQPDLLSDASGLAAWLRDHDLADAATVVTDADAASARELREALAVVLLAHVGVEQHEGALAEAESHLDRTAQLHPLTAKITAGGYALVSAQTGVPRAIGTLIAAIGDVVAGGGWLRMKMCRNAPCHASFYDKTRNSAGLYCSSACGSQVAMRAYRSRRKNAVGSP
jgi:predicted RNA-binding Zn ribbon-like protein